jgi:AraC family transcriptional regulator of adaptative response/methylated-DNA-[protein]-cysteine methyltransferase
MNLMISETLLRHTPAATAATHADVVVDILSYAIGECALGPVLVARSVSGVCAILLGADHHELEADLAARFPQATLVANEAVVHDDLAKVIRFVDKPTEGLHLTLDMRGTPLQRRVWEKLRTISVGRTVTYRELARWISPLASARVIACACAANPIALAIPCHRVVRTDGDLGGYRWGIERKRELIRKEAMAQSRASNPSACLHRSPFASVGTAVHVQHLPGDVPSLGQINHGIHDLLNGRNASHWG